ncbi:MAG: COX15/CtaA family protein [bacterium]|nr:COX15/CtaA family protein [bacterium]
MQKGSSSGNADILALGFGTSVAMWAMAYILRLPAVGAPASLTTAVLCITLLLGGYFAGRYTRRGWIGGLWTGLLSGGLNMLIVSSAISDHFKPTSSETILPAEFGMFTLAALAISAALCIFGAAFGNTRRARQAELPNWTAVLSKVAVAATLILIVAGGLVTSYSAGMAVPDWPSSFGHNMFLLPLSSVDPFLGEGNESETEKLLDLAVKQGVVSATSGSDGVMAYGVADFNLGGYTDLYLDKPSMLKMLNDEPAYTAQLASQVHMAVFLEHSHRLWGTLVGLVILVLAIHLSLSPASRVLRITAWVAFVLVCIQGALGGLRVLQNLDWAGAVHGVMAQIIFGIVAGIAVVTSTIWASTNITKRYPAASTDRTLPLILLFVLILQAAIGAQMRHTDNADLLMLHIGIGCLALGLAIFTGVRAWGLHPDVRPIKRRGTGLMHIAGIQLLLGFAAWGMGAPQETTPSIAQALLSTMHQANGALLVAGAVGVLLWNRKVLLPEVKGQGQSRIAS